MNCTKKDSDKIVTISLYLIKEQMGMDSKQLYM